MPDIIDRIEMDHPALAGHFPGNPVAPAALLVQRIAASLAQIDPDLVIHGLTRTRFRHPLKPEQNFQIRLAQSGENLWKVELVQNDASVMTGLVLTG